MATEPFLGIRERNERLGISASRGQRSKKAVLGADYAREVEINPGGRGTQFKLLELTPEGRQVLREFGVPVTAGRGRGGLAHQWWVSYIADWLEEHGATVVVEDESKGVRVDLLATIARRNVAIEIDYRKEQALHNIHKDVEAGHKRLVSLVDGFKEADAVREAASEIEAVNVVVADLREFEQVLGLVGVPKRHRPEPTGGRRRRIARAAPAETRRISIVGGVLDTPMAAEYLGLSPATLETMRSRGGGPRFSKLGRRVVYRREELDRWLEERSRRSTSDVPQ